LKQIEEVLGNLFIQLVTIPATFKQIGDVLGNFFIQLVTIRAALKQIGDIHPVPLLSVSMQHELLQVE
jgi:hypothetical protein